MKRRYFYMSEDKQRGNAIKALPPTLCTYNSRRDGSNLTQYAAPLPGEKWGPWIEHPSPAIPDGYACGSGGFHFWLFLSLEFAPRGSWPWWVQWRNQLGYDTNKVRATHYRMRPIHTKVLTRALRLGWGIGCRLLYINLAQANLSEADLRKADLSGANLYGANLTGANLYGAKLTEANLSRANLYRADLTGANLNWTNLHGANLNRANLSEADLCRTDLYGANLYGANLGGANLYRADLTGANLGGANLTGAKLREANLYKSAWNEYVIWPEGFDPPKVT